MVESSELAQRGKTKLSRTSTRKVRTGCVTCKRRHIRCDEAKPHCENCVETGRLCEGWKKPSSPVLPGSESGRLVPAALPTPQLQLNLESLDFPDDAGMLYFQEFVSLVRGPWIAGTSNGKFWGVTTPQLARTNITLRHAAMGIGALSMWYRQSGYKSLRAAPGPDLPGVEKDAHYAHAVAYYCRSLKLQSQRASLQDAVFLSVLLLYFETLRGNRKAALDHVNHGLALLLAILTDKDANRHMAGFAPNPKPLFGEVADVFTHLGTQSRTIIRGRIGHCIPLPNFAKGLRDKKETMESFMVLLSELPRSNASIDRIPSIFNDLDEYEDCWAAIQRSQIAMGPIMIEAVHASGVLESNDEEVIRRFYFEILGDSRVKEFCDQARNTMKMVEAAFLPLFDRVMVSDATSPAYLKAIHLRLQYLGAYIFGDTPQYLNVESLHALTPAFREFLSLTEIALRTIKRETENLAHHLSLQCNLAWHLLLVAFFCRDPLGRDQAIGILRDYPSQDGLWNTHALYLLTLRNRSIERENTIEGTPNEQWMRLWRREFVFEDGGDRILFRFLEFNEATRTWELVEEAADIRGESEDIPWKRQPLTGSGGLLLSDLITLSANPNKAHDLPIR